MQESLLTPDEVSELLRLSRSTIYRWIHEGAIPHLKLGSAVRFDSSELEAWVRDRSRTGRQLAANADLVAQKQ